VRFYSLRGSLVKLIRMEQGIEDHVLSEYVIPYILNICLFYFHARFVLDVCFKGHRRVALLFFLLPAELSLYLLAMGLKDYEFSQGKDFFSLIYPSGILFIRQIWRGIYFLIFSTAYWWIEKSFAKEQQLKRAETKALEEEKQKKELQLRLAQSQNAFLRAQINPHLLFNTLNFIHSEVQDTAPDASEAIITLSDMMRYSLTETKEDGSVSLEKEFEQIENLVRINQFRFEHRLCMELKTDGDFTSVRIAPLLLLPFVENLFKYAVLTEKEHPALIRAQMDNGVLHFVTENKKRRSRTFPSTGIGIANVRTRLEALYPGRFTLDITDCEQYYRVHLKLEI
jgi:two-component system LytT family sensor kinase